MKKLGKLSINPERVMKNEELVNLRGGYSGINCCYDWWGVIMGPCIYGGACGGTSGLEECELLYGTGVHTSVCG